MFLNLRVEGIIINADFYIKNTDVRQQCLHYASSYPNHNKWSMCIAKHE